MEERTFEAVAMQLRSWKIKLGLQLNAMRRRANTSDVMMMAERICPTRHNFGGQLFLSWLLENGKHSTHVWIAQEVEEWSPALKKELMKVEVPRWVMSVVATTNNISQKNTTQLFYPSLVSEWKGLSRTGMDMNAHMGTALHAKQYLSMKRTLSQQEKARSISILETSNPVIWVDNFSKTYSTTFYRVVAGTYREANYTSMALMYDPNSTPDMNIIFHKGTTIPSCSTVMLKENHRVRCVQSFCQYNNYQHTLFYDDCVARQPEYADFVVAPHHQQLENDVYGDSPNGMRGLRTFGILTPNISQNQGLLEIFQHLQALLSNQQVYQTLVVDPGIYWRAYRVCDSSSALHLLNYCQTPSLFCTSITCFKHTFVTFLLNHLFLNDFL